MATYTNLPTIAANFLAPERASFDVKGSALDGGRNGLGESISIETTGGGIVTATYEDCKIKDKEQYEYINWLGARLNGSFRFINVEIPTDWYGPFPTIGGLPRPIVSGPIPVAVGGVAANGSFLTGTYRIAGLPVERTDAVQFMRNSVGTYFDSDGLMRTAAAGALRFDHDPVSKADTGVLVEPERTNLALRSESITVSPWNISYGPCVANAAVAPDGASTATKIVRLSGQSLAGGGVTQAVAKSAVAVRYSYSCYLKAGEFNRGRILINGSDTVSRYARLDVDLSTGAIVSLVVGADAFTDATAGVEGVGNGWYRVWITGTSDTHTSVVMRVYSLDSVATVGDGVSGIYAWGAQLEVGSKPSSYIATVAAAVKREADRLTLNAAQTNDWSLTVDGGSVTLSGIRGPLTIEAGDIPSDHVRSYSATRRTNGSDLITHSDGSTFSDGSGYSQATVWGRAVSYAALNAGIIEIETYGLDRPLRHSDWFSIYHPTKGWRAYRYWDVLDAPSGNNGTYRVAISPPLREAVNTNTRIEFARPKFAAKFPSDFTLPSVVEAFFVTKQTIQFSEAF